MTHMPRTLFSQSRPELPSGLAVRILAAIDGEATRRARFRADIASGCAFSSLMVFLISLVVAGESFFSSDFWQLASLFFSDRSVVLTHFEAFFSSLAETFPAASAALLLAPLFLFLVSFSFRSRYLADGAFERSFRFTAAHPM